MLRPASAGAAGEMLHAAEPFLERHLHPTVIIRGYVKALEDALAVVDELAFPIDTDDREQMLKIIASCIGTKFTSRFGTLMPVSFSSTKTVCRKQQSKSSPSVAMVKHKDLRQG